MMIDDFLKVAVVVLLLAIIIHTTGLLGAMAFLVGFAVIVSSN